MQARRGRARRGTLGCGLAGKVRQGRTRHYMAGMEYLGRSRLETSGFGDAGKTGFVLARSGKATIGEAGKESRDKERPGVAR
jgi:hypothetical protein